MDILETDIRAGKLLRQARDVSRNKQKGKNPSFATGNLKSTARRLRKTKKKLFPISYRFKLLKLAKYFTN